MKKYAIIVFGFMLVGIGCALTLKASVGIGAWDALASSFSSLVGIEIGTANILLNCSCVLGQIIILKRNFKIPQLLQIPLSILLGVVINVVAYDILSFEVDSLLYGIILYLVASLISAVGVSMVMLVNKVTFALEGFCMAITRILRIQFHSMRQLMDIISIILVLLLSLLFSFELPLGIGTILGILLFGPSLGVFMKLLHPIFKKYGLIDSLVEKEYQNNNEKTIYVGGT